jgi:hypothetical protein
MTSHAIKSYHTLLTNSLAEDAAEKLSEGTKRLNLQIGEQPICNVLRPILIQAEQYDYIKRESTLVLSAIKKLGKAMMTDARLRSMLALSPKEEQIIAIESGYGAPDATGRFDAFFDSRGDFNLLRYNADCPVGLPYGDLLCEIFAKMRVVREFSRKFHIRGIEIRPRIMETMLRCYRQSNPLHLREHMRIAIVDWKDNLANPEFEIWREYFESKGYPAITADPDELEYRGGWLRAGDFEISVVYKLVSTGALLARCGINHPLVRAASERAVCVVNSFRSAMLAKKSLFALLDDPAYDDLFSVDEVGAVCRHIPWTRLLREGMTTYRGRRIDLLDFVLTHQNLLTLKPNGDYGGHGETRGWECGSGEWERAVKSALSESYVVQERVEVLHQSFPTLHNGEIKYEDHYVDFNPYTWCGEGVEGASIRLSASGSPDVSGRGGWTVPMLIIE